MCVSYEVLFGIKESMNMSIAIDRGIPLPEVKKFNHYPYKTMQVGESFFVPGVSVKLMCNNNGRMNKITGMKFTARKEKDGVRVWRIE